MSDYYILDNGDTSYGSFADNGAFYPYDYSATGTYYGANGVPIGDDMWIPGQDSGGGGGFPWLPVVLGAAKAYDLVSGGGPDSPNYEQIAKDQSIQSRPNIITPAGAQTWTTDSSGRPTVTTDLNPSLQAAFDLQSGMTGTRAAAANARLPDALAQALTPMDWGSLAPLSGGMAARNAAESALFDRAKSRLDPIWDQRASGLETRLYNKGFREGDAAFNAQMGEFSSARNDAYNQALWSAILGGGQEASRQQSMDLAARQQGIQEGQLRRNWGLNAINGILGDEQIGMPNFAGVQMGSAPNLLGAAQNQYQANLNSHSADQSNLAYTFGALNQLNDHFGWI